MSVKATPAPASTAEASESFRTAGCARTTIPPSFSVNRTTEGCSWVTNCWGATVVARHVWHEADANRPIVTNASTIVCDGTRSSVCDARSCDQPMFGLFRNSTAGSSKQISSPNEPPNGMFVPGGGSSGMLSRLRSWR